MSLDKSILKESIISVFTAEQSATTNPQDSIERIAKGISDAIDLFIRSATVNVSVNTTVITTGGPTSQVGTGIGTGTGNIS